MAKGDIARRILASARYKDIEIGGEKIRIREVNALQGLTLSTFVSEKGLNPDALQESGQKLYELIAALCTDPNTGEQVFEVEDVKQLHFGAFNAIMGAVNQLMAVEASEAKP